MGMPVGVEGGGWSGGMAGAGVDHTGGMADANTGR